MSPSKSKSAKTRGRHFSRISYVPTGKAPAGEAWPRGRGPKWLTPALPLPAQLFEKEFYPPQLSSESERKLVQKRTEVKLAEL